MTAAARAAAMTRGAVLLAMLSGLLGCGSVPSARWNADPSWEAMARRPLTVPVTVIADTQLHESRGTASRILSKAGDEFVPVTIRTAQQVMGAGDVLLRVLRQTRDSPLVLHLGDAIDLSCKTEWDLFRAIVSNERGRPGPTAWLLAPGNHDGFLAGNFLPTRSSSYHSGYWANLCNVGRSLDPKTGATTYTYQDKTSLIDDYASSLDLDGAQAPPDEGEPRCIGEPVRLCVAVRLSDRAPWSSFVVQLVRLPDAPGNVVPVFAILLDTSDYASQPRLGLFSVYAGTQGSVSARQLRAVSRLLGRLPPGARYFFAGHHPLRDWHLDRWNASARASFMDMMNDPRSLRFVLTAHTHEGGWFEHDLAGGGRIRELNAGSLIDAPAHYRTLAFEQDAQGRVGVVSRRVRLSDGLASTCASYVAPGKDSGYTVSDQSSQSDRASGSPPWLRNLGGALSAVGHFFAFWRAKHDELKPLLLAYADVVDSSMPSDETLTFSPFETGSRPVRLVGSVKVAARLRELAGCHHARRCSVQEKGNLLLALDRYYWYRSDVPAPVKEKAHAYRYCAAVTSAIEGSSIRDRELVETVTERTADEVMALP